MGFGMHTHFILKDGTVKAVGLNNYGQLGDTTTNNRTNLVTIPITNVKQISNGMYHTLFLMQDGTVKGCGTNEYGQLGGTDIYSKATIITLNISGVSQVACGQYSSMFLMNDGTVKSLGYNVYGQLGNGNKTNQTTFQTVPITGVKKIACGELHTIFLMQDGTVKSVGYNGFGQLANGITSGSGSAAIQNIELSNVKDIACSSHRSIFLMNDGTAKNIGYNANSQLGNGALEGNFKKIDINGISKIEAGDNHTVILLDNGKVYAFGSNEQGQLGDGTLNSSGDLIDTRLTGVVNISCTSHNSYFLFSDGSVKACGRNDFGVILNGKLSSSEPILQNCIVPLTNLISNMSINSIKKFLFQQVDQLKTWLSGNWKNVSGPLTKELFLAEGVTSLAGIPPSMLTNGTKVLKWSDDPAASTLSTTIPKSLYDPTNKLYKGIGVVETAKETLTAKPKTLIVNADHTEALLSFSLDNGVSWYNIGNGEVKNINSLTGLELKVRATLPTTTATITALSYAWA